MVQMMNSLLRSPWSIGVCLAHAAAITALWILVFMLDSKLLPGRVWMVLALTWLVWLVATVVAPLEVRRKWTLTVVIGVLIQVPAIPTLYTFLVWWIKGFAP